MQIPTCSGKPLVASALVLATFTSGAVMADPSVRTVRVAEIEIAAADVDAYEAAVKEEIADSVRLEPGVLAIYCVAEADHPNRFRFFEMYASDTAYRSHVQSPHFLNYVAITKSMIVSRKLMETVPVQLSAKQ